MPLFQAIILGIVQGLTEFLPVSSTAHLTVIPWLLGWKDPGLAFDIALHVGTLAAVLIYFFRDWMQVLIQGFGLGTGPDPALKQNRNLLWLMIVATIPAGIAGLLFQHKVETTLRSPYVIAATAIGVGLIMWWADSAGRRQKDIGAVSWGDSIVVGLAQALAVIPGVSRSGITITAGLFQGLERETAARFSFLLSTPVIAAAAAKDFWDLLKHDGGIAPDMRSAFLVGIIVSAITGCIVIRFFMNYLRERSLTGFVIYRVIFGIIVIALATFFRFNGG
jgi:undecaprenyl-diphosphatase